MNTKQPPTVKASDHESYTTYSLAAFVLPLVGFIIGAVMMTKDDKLDRKLGEHTLAVSIFGTLVWFFLWFAYINWAVSQML